MRRALDTHLTPGQAAEALGITTDHLRYLIVTKKLTPINTTLGRVYKAAEVEHLRVSRAKLLAKGKKRGRPSNGDRAA